MDRELETYYQHRFDLLNSPGWKDLMSDEVAGLLKNINEVTAVRDNDDLNFRKGQLDILYWLVSLPELTETVYQDLKNASTL